MRLWHKDLIEVLPRQQLLGQWRECCAIAKNISTKGTPGHLLVNKIMGYDIEEFITYSRNVWSELNRRGYYGDWRKFYQHLDIYGELELDPWFCKAFDLFHGWHNWEYLDECYYNLREKWNCGGVPDDEWNLFVKRYFELKEI